MAHFSHTLSDLWTHLCKCYLGVTHSYPNRLKRGFAVGWDYALGWLTVLPFELTAAGITIQFWRTDINIGVWITVFLVFLTIVQYFGVRGFGEGLCLKINHALSNTDIK